MREYGPALRGEGSNGRWADAHDPSGLLRAVVVQVEQEEGGTLPGRQHEEHPTNVFAELHLVEGIVCTTPSGIQRRRAARREARIRIRLPFNATLKR